jgi:polar amino acid transport system substrate-binding protein
MEIFEMHKHRPTLVAIGIATALVGLTGCGGKDSSSVASDCTPAHKFSTLSKGKIAVAIQELPPFLSTRGEGGMSGVEGDIFKLIAKKECLQIKAVSPSTAAMVPSVQNGRVDAVIGNWYRNQARTSILNFTDPIYVDDMGIASADGISTFDEMKGKTVGIADGSLWQGELTKLFGDKLKLYPSSTNLRQDLDAGRIQVWIDSYGAQQYAAKTDKSFKVEKAKPDARVATSSQPPQIGFMLTKSNKAMLKAFNADLAELSKAGKIKKILVDNGLDPSSADVGAPRLISD